MHGHAHAVHIEGHGTGREIGLALGFEAMPLRRASRVEIYEGDFPVGAKDRIILEPAVARLAVEMAAGELEDVVSKCSGRQRDRLARDDGTRARESPGIVRR